MTKYVNNNGVSEMWLNIKNWVTSQLLGYSQTGHTHSASDITSGLSTVATSGSYNDLTDKPTIPTVNNATLTIQKNGTTVKTFTANASSNVTANITVPTKTSELTNDSGFITADNTKIPLAGTNALAGSIVPDRDNSYDLGSSSHNFKIVYAYAVYNGVNNKSLVLSGGNNATNGANLVLYGANRTDTFQGNFLLTANDGTSSYVLKGHQSGMLSWSGNVIRPTTDNICDLGSSNYFFKNTYSKTMYVETLISSDNTCGIVFGTNSSEKHLRPRGADNNAIILGTTFARWKEIWCTQSSINSSSDERQKQQIKPIDNDLLDAWENVNPIEFKWNDAVKEKGDNARVHTGYIAQNIQQALTENGVNPNDYGLFLYDEWGEEQEEKDEQGNIIKPYRPSGNAYGLRYTEALIVECAYLRKKLKELTARIEDLEKGNNSK